MVLTETLGGLVEAEGTRVSNPQNIKDLRNRVRALSGKKKGTPQLGDGMKKETN